MAARHASPICPCCVFARRGVLKNCPWYILRSMRPLRCLALTFTILIALAPQLACFLPEQRVLTAGEMECCEHMSGDCGRAFMQAHECCAGTVRLDLATLDKTRREVSSLDEFTALGGSADLPDVPGSTYVAPLFSEATHAPPADLFSPSLILRI